MISTFLVWTRDHNKKHGCQWVRRGVLGAVCFVKLKVFLNSVQALEETKMNQVRIISELEKEKKKMQDDVSKLKEAKVTYFT